MMRQTMSRSTKKTEPAVEIYNQDKPKRTLNQIVLLRDINLEIKRGDFVIIIGEIGSGKSSLISSILGEMLYVPQNEINVFGGLEKELDDKEIDQLNHALYNLEDVKDDAQYAIQINSSISWVE